MSFAYNLLRACWFLFVLWWVQHTKFYQDVVYIQQYIVLPCSENWFYDIAPPKKQRSSLTNERFMAAPHKECCYYVRVSTIFFFAMGFWNLTSRWQGAPYFRRYGLELVSEPAILLTKNWGGGGIVAQPAMVRLPTFFSSCFYGLLPAGLPPFIFYFFLQARAKYCPKAINELTTYQSMPMTSTIVVHYTRITSCLRGLGCNKKNGMVPDGHHAQNHRSTELSYSIY